MAINAAARWWCSAASFEIQRIGRADGAVSAEIAQSRHVQLNILSLDPAATSSH